MSDELFSRGLAVRKRVLGPEYVEERLQEADRFGSELQRFETEFVWGLVWSRPGLDAKTRCMLNLLEWLATSRHGVALCVAPADQQERDAAEALRDQPALAVHQHRQVLVLLVGGECELWVNCSSLESDRCIRSSALGMIVPSAPAPGATCH